MLIRKDFISLSPSDGTLPNVPPLEFADHRIAEHLCCGINRDARLSPFSAHWQRQVMQELACRRERKTTLISKVVAVPGTGTDMSLGQKKGLATVTIDGDKK